MSAKNLLCTIAVGMAAGAVLGIMYAPADGAETRRRIRKLKQKFGCYSCVEDNAEEEKALMEELSRNLQKELDRINEKLASL
jgi:gas vesicle protein